MTSETVTYIDSINNDIQTKIKGLIDKWKKGRLSSYDKLSEVLSAFSTAMTNMYKAFTEQIKTAISDALTPIKNAFQKVYEGITGAFGTVKTWLDTALSSITTGFEKMISWATDGFTNTWATMSKNFVSLSDYSYAGTLLSWNGVIKGFDTFGNNLLGGIKEMFTIVNTGLMQFADYFVNVVKSMMDNAEEFVNQAFTSMQNFINKWKADNLAEYMKTLDVGED